MPPISANAKKPKNAKSTLLRVIRYLAAYRFVILGIFLLCILSNALSLMGPSFAGSAVNAAAAGKGKVDIPVVFVYAKKMLAVYVISSLLTVGINTTMLLISKWFARKMRRDVFEKLLRLPVGFFDRNPAGDLISRVSYDIDVISTCLATDIAQIMTSLVTVLGSLGMMIWINPLLSTVILITIPASVGYTAFMRKNVSPRYSKRSRSYGVLNGFVEEMFSGQKTIQAYAYESSAQERFQEVNTAAVNAYQDAEYYGCTIGPTMGVINNSSLALITLLGSLLFMGGRVDLGQVSSFILYSRKFSGPINEIANIVNEIFSGLSAAERVFDLLDQQEETADLPGATVLEKTAGAVTMDHVSFGYEPGKIVLHDLSMEAVPGELIAIVGPTGAGKTTIINLLMRFYDVNSGSICVDGTDIRKLTRSSLRRAYAMVLQDTWVFSGTIFENIAYGRTDATMDEVIKAAKATHIHSFIMQLPDGYDTVITEDGGNISRGQKQLLTIARAMLYDASMLILDEATSNVDTSTERQVQKAVQDLMAGKTCFVIAHRLSTIQSADRILVVDHGDVVEQGTHKSLMAARGTYYKLYTSQFE